MSPLRGYHVMVIVLCLMVCAAITLCYITWRFRYKITLRTGTASPGLTYVQEKLLETYNDLEAAETTGQNLLPRNSNPSRSRPQLPRTLSSVKFSSGKVMSLSNSQQRWRQLRAHVRTEMMGLPQDDDDDDDDDNPPEAAPGLLGELGSMVRRDTEESGMSEEFQCLIPLTLRDRNDSVDERKKPADDPIDPLGFTIPSTRSQSNPATSPATPSVRVTAPSRSGRSTPATSPGHSRPPSVHTIQEHSE